MAGRAGQRRELLREAQRRPGQLDVRVAAGGDVAAAVQAAEAKLTDTDTFAATLDATRTASRTALPAGATVCVTGPAAFIADTLAD